MTSSAVELVDEAIARIEAVNPRLNIVVATDFERARSKASAADAALAASESVGPLHGLPITVKDSFETADLVTTCGSPEFRYHVPGHERLDRATPHRSRRHHLGQDQPSTVRK